jgi:hypothetical protein
VTIKVPLGDLSIEIDARGPYAYLVTVGADSRPHLLHNPVAFHEGLLTTITGRSSRRNAAVNPSVVLVWPPATDAQLTLFVDGTAVIDGDALVITPTHAILHRRADR